MVERWIPLESVSQHAQVPSIGSKALLKDLGNMSKACASLDSALFAVGNLGKLLLFFWSSLICPLLFLILPFLFDSRLHLRHHLQVRPSSPKRPSCRKSFCRGWLDFPLQAGAPGLGGLAPVALPAAPAAARAADPAAPAVGPAAARRSVGWSCLALFGYVLQTLCRCPPSSDAFVARNISDRQD